MTTPRIRVWEAYGGKRSRSGLRPLLFWEDTGNKLTRIDSMYPATVPIKNEVLHPDTMPKTEETKNRLMRFQKKYDTCGGWMKSRGKGGIMKGTACKKHIKTSVQIAQCHCGRPGCELCGDTWAWRLADRVKENLMGYRQAYANEGYNFAMFDHVVFSVPPSEYDRYEDMIPSNKTYPVLRVEMRKILKIAGVKGCGEFFHIYRFKHEDGSNCEEKGCTLHHTPEFAPHWHTICIGYLKPSNQFYEDTGWVYKKIQKDLSPRKIKAVAHYLATHSALLIGKDTNILRHNVVTYSGMFAPSKIRVKHRREFTQESCDICGEQKYHFVANMPSEGEEFEPHHILRWEDPVEYWGDRRYFYLPQTIKATQDQREMCDHG